MKTTEDDIMELRDMCCMDRLGRFASVMAPRILEDLRTLKAIEEEAMSPPIIGTVEEARPDYDYKTCEGCVHYDSDEYCACEYNWVDSPNVGGRPLVPIVTKDNDACERFKPNLECRNARALERIADAVERRAELHAETVKQGEQALRDAQMMGKLLKLLSDAEEQASQLSDAE